MKNKAEKGDTAKQKREMVRYNGKTDTERRRMRRDKERQEEKETDCKGESLSFAIQG